MQACFWHLAIPIALAVTVATKPAAQPLRSELTAQMRDALARLEHEKSVEALTRLLDLNGVRMTGIEQIGNPRRNEPDEKHGIHNVNRITSGGDEFVVVHARRFTDQIRRFNKTGLGVAFVFDADGVLDARLGGEVGPDGVNGDDVRMITLGTPDRWFIWVSRSEKHEPFTYLSDIRLVAPGLPRAFRVRHFPNATAWTSEPMTGSEYPDPHYFWFDGEKDSLKWGLRGTAANNQRLLPVIAWKPKDEVFAGPSRMSYNGKPVYEIDLAASHAFEATDIPNKYRTSRLDSPLSTQPAGYEGEVKRVIDSTLTAYAGLRTYQDVYVQFWDVDADQAVRRRLEKEKQQRYSLAIELPNRIALDGPRASVHCDGKTLWLYLKDRKQYRAIDATSLNLSPRSVDASDWLNNSHFYLMEHPLVRTILGAGKGRASLPYWVSRWQGVKRGEEIGAGRVRADGLTTNITWPENDRREWEMPLQFLVDEKTWLMKEVLFDYTSQYREDAATAAPEGQQPLRIGHAFRRQRFENMRINEPIPRERFVFTPGVGDVRVSHFDSDDTPAQGGR